MIEKIQIFTYINNAEGLFLNRYFHVKNYPIELKTKWRARVSVIKKGNVL